MKKRLFALIMVLLVAFALVACGNGGKEEGPKGDVFEIAVVTDVGQLNDGGFNQGTYEGVVAYAEANNKTYKYYQPANGADATDNDRIAAMRLAIENGAKVIVTPGFLQATAISTVAKESPNVKFIFVDGWALGEEYANVTAISYKEEESGFLAGYAAVMEGYTKLGGTFGGDGTNAACNRFAYGYVQGIQAAAAAKGLTGDAKPQVKISFQYGGSFSASNDLKFQIAGWYAAGTEIVFSCGGAMLQSVKAAAAETTNGKIIGVDVDQAGESDRVVTSAVKGLAVSVQKVLGECYEGKWDAELANKCSNLGAKDDATGLPTAAASWRFENFTVAQYNELFAGIKNGTIVILSDVGDANMKTAAAAPWVALKAAAVNIDLTIE